MPLFRSYHQFPTTLYLTATRALSYSSSLTFRNALFKVFNNSQLIKSSTILTTRLRTSRDTNRAFLRVSRFPARNVGSRVASLERESRGWFGCFRKTRESGWPLESALPLTRRDPLLWQQLGCSAGRRTCEECRQDPLEAVAAAGVERAQRRVTQEAAMKTKGGGKSGHPARSFSQQLDVFHAASDRPVEMFEGTRLGVDLFRSKYASRRSSQSKR